MAKEGTFTKQARAHGLEPAEFARQMVEQHGTLAKASRMLDVNRNTIRYWLDRGGYTTRFATEVVKVERAS